jgi:site-specific recombinase XerD
LKTKFSPGVLTRAYRLKPWVPSKRRRRTMDGYLLECAQKLYPQSVIDDYTKVCCSQSIARQCSFIPHLKSMLTQLSPSRLDEAADEQQLEIFKAWARAYGRSQSGCRERGFFPDMQAKLRKLGIHASYLAAVDEDYSKVEKDLFDRWVARVDPIIVSTPMAKKFRWCSFKRLPAFLGILEELYILSGVRDPTTCGKISRDCSSAFAAINLGRGRKHMCCESKLHIPKAELLVLTGFEGSIVDLEADIAARGKCLSRYAEVMMKELPGEQLTGTHYLMLRKLLGVDPWSASVLPIDLLQDRFTSFDAKAACAELGLKHSNQYSVHKLFKLFEVEMKWQGAEDKCSQLRGTLPGRSVGVTAFEQLHLCSQWHSNMADIALRGWRALGNGSAHPEEQEVSDKYHVAECVSYVAKYATEAHQADIPEDSSAFRWFVENATTEMLQAATRSFMKEANRCHKPRLVRSCQDVHSATRHACRMIRFFKSLAPEVLPSECVSGLILRKLLRQVDNVRTPADQMVRRTYRVEEVNSMLAACATDSKLTLLLLLLSEIGLRHAALRHLKYYDLVDAAHQPRHICSVLEKGRARRNFVTSARLKDAITNHLQHIRSSVSDRGPELANIFVLSEEQPIVPISYPTIIEWLRKLAKVAGVTEVIMHPHAFRHTIVGWLMDAGNSLEVVSKYMGHKSLDTTSSHYWVADVQHLHESLNNPMTGSYQDNVRDEDLKDKELEVLRKKKSKAMEIIATLLGTLDEVKNTGGGAEDVATGIKEAMPNLAEVLRIIGEDEE